MMDDVFFSCARFSMSLLAGVKAKLRDEAVSVEVVTGGEKGLGGEIDCQCHTLFTCVTDFWFCGKPHVCLERFETCNKSDLRKVF